MNMRKGLALLLCATLLFSCLPAGIAGATAQGDAPAVAGDNPVETTTEPSVEEPAPPAPVQVPPVVEPPQELVVEPPQQPVVEPPQQPVVETTTTPVENDPVDNNKEGSGNVTPPAELASDTPVSPAPKDTPKEPHEHHWKANGSDGHVCECGESQPHSLNAMEECTVCGWFPAQLSCKQHNYQIDESVGTPGKEEGKPVYKDADYHTVHVTYVINNGLKECTECHDRVSGRIVTGEKDVDKPHTWISLGADAHRCSGCGHEEAHKWIEQEAEDGTIETVCSACGEVMAADGHVHQWVEDSSTVAYSAIEGNNDAHQVSVTVKWKCASCGEEKEETTVSEQAHQWTEADGATVCSACGMVKAAEEAVCEHVWEKKDGDVHVCTLCGQEEAHKWALKEVADGKTKSVCEVCSAEKQGLFGSIFGALFGDGPDEDPNADGTTVTLVGEDGEEHNFAISDFVSGESEEDGIMTLSMGVGKPTGGSTKICPNPASHVWKIVSESSTDSDPAQIGGDQGRAYHKVTRTTTARLQCTKCGATATGTASNETALRPHSWSGGKCTACGAVENETCKHEKTYLDRYTVTHGDRLDYNRTTHTYFTSMRTVKRCAICNAELDVIDESKQRKIATFHQFNEYGDCVVCGYHSSCTHPASKRETWTEVVSAESVPKAIEGNKHQYTEATLYRIEGCIDCGTVISRTLLQNATTYTESCTFENGKCTVCGRSSECDHSKTTTYTVTSQIYDIKSNGTKTHTYRADETTVTRCTKCGEILSEKVVTNVKHKDEHSFVKGYCNVCGAKKGKTSKSVSATPTPTPVPLRTDEMVTALLIDIQREMMTAGTSVEIVGADQVLTETELARFAALTMPEKLLVTFTALGMQPDTVYGMQTMNAYPSPAAQTLIADVAARRSRMTAEERAAMDAAIATYFPKLADATGAQTIMVTLRVVTPTGTVDHRYTFRYDTVSRLWLYVKTELVNEESIGVK